MKNGALKRVGRPPVAFEARIKKLKSGCWTWTGSLNKKGYGQAWFKGRMRGAHRVSWMMTNGPVPKGLFVCHTCDVPACVNPKHLWLGTNSDNMKDCYSKGRRVHSICAGKLTAAQVRKVKNAYASRSSRKWGAGKMAVLLGVSNVTIAAIVTGKTHKMVAA